MIAAHLRPLIALTLYLALCPTAAVARNAPPNDNSNPAFWMQRSAEYPVMTLAADEISPGNSDQQTLMTRAQAEIGRLEAERMKLELEAKEIELRLNARWWQDQSLPQYLLAIVVTAALLFGWTRAYLEPILNLKGEIHKLTVERDALVSAALQEKSSKLKEENEQLNTERAAIATERDRLKQGNERLTEESAAIAEERDRLKHGNDALKLTTAGLKIAVKRAAKGEGEFFSILNNNDPICKLERYGWSMFSDNYIGPYHLVIAHPDVRSVKQIVVLRTFDIERQQKAGAKEWKRFVALANKRHGPILALDYSYFMLLSDENAAIGGILYAEEREDVQFYAPLAEWKDRLKALFPT